MDERKAATPEPMIKPGTCDVFPELIKDIKAREKVGIYTYNTSLQTHNGRDLLNDAYQEVLDLAVYMKQHILEKEYSFQEHIWRWGAERKLYDTATPYTQLRKLLEEIDEWRDELQKDDPEKEAMELGDILVVLTNIAIIRGFDLSECGWMAYRKIKDRTGKMVSGTFVKD